MFPAAVAETGDFVLNQVPPLAFRPGQGTTVSIQALKLPEQAAVVLFGGEQVGHDPSDQGEHLLYGRQVEDHRGPGRWPR